MDDEEDVSGIDLAEEELEPPADNPVVIENVADDSEGGDFEHIRPPDRRLITQPYDLAIGDLVTQVTTRSLHLQPVYQRKYVWDNRKASKLVESLLINVPIPVCYLADEADGSRSVIDGQQRMRSLVRFLDNQFALTGLEVLSDLNRKKFHRLTERQQRLIRNRTIRCIVITEDSDPEIRFDVFERLNTGSVPLNAQELRNSVFRGSFNTMLRETAQSSEFRRCLANRDDSRMAFEELVLRFMALDERLGLYRPNLKRFLNSYMRDHHDLGEKALEEKQQRFLATAEKAFVVFGGECFRRAEVDQETDEWDWRPTVNSAMFDAVMLNFARVDAPLADFRKARREIEQMTASLTFDNDDFEDAISRATGDRTRLFTRVSIYAKELRRLGFESAILSEISG
ncbi:DUF262 domain-containing protein [Conexibacter sp. JD483]|uniref:DUF262 domain-containing protein n=1 Tax=unclassified Conexibacter TaxID=2627773 RepID=UPI002721A612|nr:MULTISPECIES: DUF262 domain-containing protein [unclassified Conexibacter]MDO8186390.1 DUF262 domain-containing protein [Conexibacter sp. CPCC 205706]MDO8199789.1 DUF262 domain-containing protein [Conexibacter sp. CPCC 205762]MDR9369191.1 DUF262 domain-containing protein [Conexibacter sp. JD483]